MMQEDKDGGVVASAEEEFVQLEEMDREDDTPFEPQEPTRDDDAEEVLSQVFAVDQLKRGAEAAASYFNWGFAAVKEKAQQVSESEQVKQVLETTKPQREAISSNVSQLWEKTRPTREEISRSASNLSQQVEPTLQKIKTESLKAFDSFSNSAGNAAPSSPLEEEKESGDRV